VVGPAAHIVIALANSVAENIDAALANFLVKFFPQEVKAKQKENEHAAGVDLYGESYNDKCCIM
jgi:E3 ubiquitin-protein ligase BAH